MSAAQKRVLESTFTSDASGAWGGSGYWDDKWFQLAWEDTQCSSPVNITVKELIPIVLAAAAWGLEWQGKVVGWRCNKQAVVAVLHSRTSKEPDIMYLLQCLFFFEARFSFHVIASHICRHGKLFSWWHFSQPSTPSVGPDHQYQTELHLTSLETDVQWYFEYGLAATRKISSWYQEI